MKTSDHSSKNTYPLRLLAGFYLLYLGYSLAKDWQNHDKKIFFLIFIILFAVVGIMLVITSALGILRNKQVAGSNDSEQESIPEDVEAEDEIKEETDALKNEEPVKEEE